MRRLTYTFFLSVWVLFFPLLSYSVELLYPVGIADVEDITGAPFNINALRNVPMYIYMGDQDDNEPPADMDRVEPDNDFVTKDFFGITPIERWHYSFEMYDYLGLNATFALYPGVAHEITDQMHQDVIHFFRRNGNDNQMESMGYQFVKVYLSESTRNFHWPYYLLIPENPRPSDAFLLVEPNNTGFKDDNPEVHDEKAYEAIQHRLNIALPLGTPLLMPTFPRYYTHEHDYSVALQYLNWNALKYDVEKYMRVDLQLIEMIEDAKERLASLGINTSEKVFMMGYSASGGFTSRFTMLHPELIKAAAIGAPCGWPIAPVANWPPRWDSEIGVINTQSSQLQGSLRGALRIF